MSGLFGGGAAQTTTPDYTGLQIQTAVNTLPIPIVWGASRLAPNVIWYNNFQTKESGGGKGSGGKGGLFGSSSGAVSYTYSAAVIMALCEGPISGINQIWKNQSLYTLSGLGLSLFTGTTPQTEWSYLATAYPAQALGYQGTAYVCASDYSLGDTATLDNHNFEVQGFYFGTGYGQLQYNSQDVTGSGSGYGFVDADPAQVVSDFLTNAQYGVGFPQASIDATALFSAPGGNDASYQTYYQIDQRTRLGVCSTFVGGRIAPGHQTRVYVQIAQHFALPQDPKKPIIMIGPGTGIAPFRAFLHERQATAAPGRNWLFFGHQRSSHDFFYEEELLAMRAAGHLTRLTLAWSRDGNEKVYVQNRMSEVGRDLWSWLNDGAHVYVCGDALRMAKDVETALIEIVAQHGGCTPAEAVKFVAELKSKGRYQADVY